MIEKNWKELIKPSKLEVRQEKNPEFTATIIAEPLERGYGVTHRKRIKKNIVIFATRKCYYFFTSARCLA